MLDLYVVRHGRTAWNRDKRFQGQTDVALDDEGRAQARSLARMLAEVAFDAAIASDLIRARETAQLIVGSRRLVVESDPRLREMAFGAWEGLTWAQIVERTPALDGADPRDDAFVPAGGETFAQLCERVGAAFRALVERFAGGGTVLVATHAGPLHALVRVAAGASEARALNATFTPGSLTRLRVDRAGVADIVELDRLPAETASGRSD